MNATLRTALLRRTLVKVPEITAVFWIAKILTTAMGEALSDYSVHATSPELAVVAAFAVFLVVIRWQLLQDRYRPWVYWSAVAMVAVFGTMAADVVHIGLGVPYVVSSAAYAVALAAVFWLWHRTEGTLSIHSVETGRREAFYWLAVLATFALGTAAGDMTAASFDWGYLASGIAFGLVMACALAMYLFTGFNRIAIFWFAYVFTRPFGASFADYVGKNIHGGLGVGDEPVVAALLAAIVVTVAYLAHGPSTARRRALALQPQE